MKRCLNCMKEYQGEGNICPWCGYDQKSGPKELYYLQPGTILADRYVVGVQINTGGFGIIYKAWDNTLAESQTGFQGKKRCWSTPPRT